MAILKYKDKDGNFVVLPTGGGSSAPPIAEDVSYDNSSSGLKAEDTQAAIDELSENIINYSIDETGTGLTIDGGFITQLTVNNNCILINKTTSKTSSVENLKDENNNIYNFNDFDFLILTMHSSYGGSGEGWEMEPALITPKFYKIKKNIGLSYNNGTSRSVIVTYIDDTHIGFIDTYTGFEEFYVYGIILKNKTFGINKKQHHYSTDEQVVGTWINKKPIYEIVTTEMPENIDEIIYKSTNSLTSNSLIPVMTSDTEPYGKATASANRTATYQSYAYAAFNNIDSPWWDSYGGGNCPQWVMYEFPEEIYKRITQIDYKMLHEADTSATADIQFQVSIDGEKWEDIHSVTVTMDRVVHQDIIDITKRFKFFRVYFSRSGLDSQQCRISYVKLIGQDVKPLIIQYTKTTD